MHQPSHTDYGNSTAAMAGRAPLERNDTVRLDGPGAWPATPANELEQFSVNPIPATASEPVPGGEGSSNPVTLAAGESVPEPSTFTEKTIGSHVKHEEPTEATRGADLDEAHNTEGTEITNPAEDAEKALGVAPIPATSSNPVPGGEGSSNPIKLAPGEAVPEPSTYTANTLDSHVAHDEPNLEEGDVPGGFPTTPANELEQYSVDPIPATSREPVPGGEGSSNPIKLAAGEAVPHPSTFSDNTIHSAVGDMKSETGAPQLPPVLSPSSEEEANGGSMFNLPPIGSGSGPMIPESSIPMGGAAGFGDVDFTPTLSSAAPQSTTATLAGQVPIRERGVAEVEPAEQKSAVEDELKSVVPEADGIDGVGHGNDVHVPAVVTESQHRAHAEPEATASPVAVEEKSNMEDELKAAVPEAPATSESGIFGNSERGITGAIAGGALAAGGAIAAAAYAAKEQAQPALNQAAEYTQPALDGATEYAQPALDKASEYTGQSFGQTADKSIPEAPVVPESVVESQLAAHVSPEASADAEAVAEKSAVEEELKARVPEEPATSESGLLGKSEDGISGKLGAGVAAGTAAVAGAAGYAGLSSDKPVHDASTVPETVVESQHVAHASPEASADAEAVREKSAMEEELKAKVHQEPATSESGLLGKSEGGISDKVGAGIAAGTAAVAGAAGYGAYSAHESASTVPSTVTESQREAHASPEASADAEAVREKAAVENELKSVVDKEPATSESGLLGKSEGGLLGSLSSQTAAHLPSTEASIPAAPAVPDVVTESQHAAHAAPEASGEPEAVQEKSAVEDELKARVPEEPATSESGVLGNSESGIAGKVTAGVAAGTAAAGAAAAGYAYTARDKAAEATGQDKHTFLPPSVQSAIDSMNNNKGTTAPAYDSAASNGIGESVPEQVVESQEAAHSAPEASAYPEAVAEKSQVERELLSEIKPHNESGEPAPTASAALSAVAPVNPTTNETLGSSTSGLRSFEEPDFGPTTIQPLDQPSADLPDLPVGATAATSGSGLTEPLEEDVSPTVNTSKSPLSQELKEDVSPITPEAPVAEEKEETKAPTMTALAESKDASSSAPAVDTTDSASLKKERSPFDPKSDSDRLAAPAGASSESRDVSPMSKGPRAPEDSTTAPAAAPTTPQKDKMKRSSSMFRSNNNTPASTKTSGTPAEASSPDKKKKGFFGRLKEKFRG